MKIKILAVSLFVLCLSLSAAAQTPTRTDDKTTKHADKTMKTDDKMMKSDDKMMKNMSAEQMLVQMEKDAWQHLVDKKYDEFGKILADDYQGVYSDGIIDKASELAQVRKMTFKSADVTDARVRWIDNDAAIVTSTVRADVVAADGRETNDSARTSTVMVKRDGKWMVLYHTNTMMK